MLKHKGLTTEVFWPVIPQLGGDAGGQVQSQHHWAQPFGRSSVCSESWPSLRAPCFLWMSQLPFKAPRAFSRSTDEQFFTHLEHSWTISWITFSFCPVKIPFPPMNSEALLYSVFHSNFPSTSAPKNHPLLSLLPSLLTSITSPSNGLSLQSHFSQGNPSFITLSKFLHTYLSRPSCRLWGNHQAHSQAEWAALPQASGVQFRVVS